MESEAAAIEQAASNIKLIFYIFCNDQISVKLLTCSSDFSIITVDFKERKGSEDLQNCFCDYVVLVGFL